MRNPNYTPASPLESVRNYQKEEFLVQCEEASLVINKQTTYDSSIFIYDFANIHAPVNEQLPTILAQRDIHQPQLTHYTMFWNEPVDGILRPHFEICDAYKEREELAITPIIQESVARNAFYKASTFGRAALKLPCQRGSYVLRIDIRENNATPTQGISTEIAPEDRAILEHFGIY